MGVSIFSGTFYTSRYSHVEGISSLRMADVDLFVYGLNDIHKFEYNDLF